MRYCIAHDNSGHEFYIPVDKRDDWDEWLCLPDDDERGWNPPDYARYVDGIFTFTDPKCE